MRVDDTNGDAEVNGWVYDFVGGFWFRGGVKFRHMHGTILEVFDYGEYELLNIRDRVVDVGAYIGDSAIYFALKGAKRVIAVEPHPNAYAEMLENIRLNNLEDIITPINAGLASKPGKICINNVDLDATVVTYHRPGNCNSSIPAVTLGELMSRFSINGGEAVLKMDCQGCEFDVILNDYEHVRLFKEVIFEYHTYIARKSVIELTNTMNKDFDCQLYNEEFFMKHLSSYPRDQLGLLRCVRKG